MYLIFSRFFGFSLPASVFIHNFKWISSCSTRAYSIFAFAFYFSAVRCSAKLEIKGNKRYIGARRKPVSSPATFYYRCYRSVLRQVALLQLPFQLFKEGGLNFLGVQLHWHEINLFIGSRYDNERLKPDFSCLIFSSCLIDQKIIKRQQNIISFFPLLDVQ